MKKIVLGILIGVLISASTAVFAMRPGVFFGDVRGDEWYGDAVDALSEIGIFQGYEDGSFKPSQKVNRAELAVVLERMLLYIETGEVPMGDDDNGDDVGDDDDGDDDVADDDVADDDDADDDVADDDDVDDDDVDDDVADDDDGV